MKTINPRSNHSPSRRHPCLAPLLIAGGGVALLAGCGQKGALYLPDKNAAVITRPATQTAPAPAAQSADDKDKKDNDSAPKPQN